MVELIQWLLIFTAFCFVLLIGGVFVDMWENRHDE
tara:strand:+ start:673 stop:777 length:105 start_codon:yes stop_codon:yes gene_type:complete